MVGAVRDPTNPAVNVLEYEAWELPYLEHPEVKSNTPNQLEWHFFSPHRNKYLNGRRVKRTTKAGYWKVTGKDRKIYENGSKNVVNQTTAKASLIQMLVIVFRRMEADSSTVPIQPIVVAELMEPVEKSDADGSMTMFVQGFITKIMQDIDGVLNPGTPGKVSLGAHDGAFETTTVETTNPADLLDSTDKDMLDAKYWEISMYKTALGGGKGNWLMEKWKETRT
ncbi:hypothetical protein GH714_043769 [Hevea brasiliensis]|uniref:NAC domain-containing protein n=1 Tax=Hevea brasiliensis TaxID=3981 RepID=A0A6A6K5J6_HEVBR|nr:hypothetical protein GH714_043769 [Hevea brasiliensis]